MDMFDHPGNLGPTRGSLFTIHHADWPAYPQGGDFRTPLLQLTAFPPDTEFNIVDNVDQSVLLVANVKGARLAEPFHERNFHVAVWHEDLIEFGRHGLAKNIRAATEFEWRKDQFAQMTKDLPEGSTIGFIPDGGEFVPIHEPSLNEYDDDPMFAPYALCQSRKLVVTDSGREFLLSELRAETIDMDRLLGGRITKLFELRFYDTCIREACVHLEADIKRLAGSEAWGDQLVKQYVDLIQDKGDLLESFVRTSRQELRCIFKFIRNSYMHNLHEADEASAYSILFRIVRIRSALDIGV